MAVTPGFRRLCLALLLLVTQCGGRLEAGERAPALVLDGARGGQVRCPAGSGREAAPPSSSATVVVFVDVLQEQSVAALADVRACLARLPQDAAKLVRPIAIASGELDAAAVAALDVRLPAEGPIVAALDPRRTASVAFGVIAVPTTFVIDGGGAITASIPGRSVAHLRRLEEAIRRTLALPAAPDPGGAVESPESARVALLRKAAAELARERRFADAAQRLADARALRPDDADLAVLHGNVLLDVPDDAGAAAAYSRALELRPSMFSARSGLARALASGGDPDAAEKMLRDVLRSPSADSACRYYLGRVLERKGDAAGAAGAYREAYERLRRGD